MSALSLTGHQVKYDLRAFSRNPRARVFTLATPVILLLLLLSIFHNGTIKLDGQKLILAEYYVPHIISGDVVTSISSALVIAAVLTLIGVLFFHVKVNAAVIGVTALLCILSAACYSALAYAASVFVGTVEAAAPVVQLTTLPLYFLSGVFIPSTNLPNWLNDLMSYLPVRPLGVALQAAFVPATNGGNRVDWSAVLVILVWGVAGLLFAMRRFSWAPHRK